MTKIVALYNAHGGETVFEVLADDAAAETMSVSTFDENGTKVEGKRITVADGTDLLTGRIGGLSGYVDAYICWIDEEPVMRVPVWSVTAIYEKEEGK